MNHYIHTRRPPWQRPENPNQLGMHLASDPYWRSFNRLIQLINENPIDEYTDTTSILTDGEVLRRERIAAKTHGSNSCTLAAERGMPASNATGEKWAAYHQARVGRGGYNPLDLVRGTR